VLVDLKTTNDASPEGFIWAVRRYLYHLQAAFYVDGWEAAGGGPIDEFIFIAVEKTPPFAVGLYRLPESALIKGRDLYRQGLDTFNRCLTRQVWPGYSQEIMTLDV
jgi:exodeoxyribonuclease VIII